MAETQDFKGLLEWRCIGPFRGGRVVAVAGDPSEPNTFYFGGVAGGIWKTADGGISWECISDGFLKTLAVLSGCSDAHVDDDLRDAGKRHRVVTPQLLRQLRQHFFEIFVF